MGVQSPIVTGGNIARVDPARSARILEWVAISFPRPS